MPQFTREGMIDLLEHALGRKLTDQEKSKSFIELHQIFMNWAEKHKGWKEG